MIKYLLIPLLLCILPAGNSSAQTTGKIAGTVIDAETGDPLIGVNVTVEEGAMQGASTNIDGYYAILNVSPGLRTVRFSYVGYGVKIVENVRVKIGKTAEVNVELSYRTIQGQEVTVTAERPIVDPDLTSTSMSVSSEEIAALPVQSLSQVINLQAGVVNGHFRGGRTGEVTYLVDGFPINDVYSQAAALQVEPHAVQELQIITGVFNAEYGQAQSGVVNIVTKEGGRTYKGTAEAFIGDYVTGATGLFPHIGQLSPLGTYGIQGTLSGPVAPRLTFFASGRLVHNEGYLYGRRFVEPVYAEQGSGNGELVFVRDETTVFVPEFGDTTYASMNWSSQATAHVALTARLFGSNKLSVSSFLQRDRGQDYNHLFRINPGGLPTTYGDTWSIMGSYSLLFSSKTFVELRGGFFRNGTESYVYENPLDPRYPYDRALDQLGGNFSFYRGGAVMRHFTRETDTYIGSIDFTSQVTRNHLLQAGSQVKFHRLGLDAFEVKNNAGTGNDPAVPPIGTPDHVKYTQRPVELSAYIQDKMEFDFLVINAGLRIDYFDARATILKDFGRPTTSPRVEAPAQWQLSPRIGLSYPISEQGAVRVAYGHFFQMPPFEFLYTNPNYIYDPEEGLSRAFGHAGLEAQHTVAYELGLQQAFTSTIGMDMTIYFKDIRNLLGTRLEVIERGYDEPFPLSKYGRFINRDYGQVKGMTVAFEKRMSNGYSVTLDYTYQIAKGNASDPRNRLLDEANDVQTEKQLVPLNWDRRHQLVLTATAGNQDLGILSVVGQFRSGKPYTPSVASQRTGFENSARMPATLSFDLYAEKAIDVAGLQTGLFLRVYNLFDARNVRQVYTDTGRTDPNLRYYPGLPQGLNTKEEFLQRPDFYLAPRQVMVGATFSF